MSQGINVCMTGQSRPADDTPYFGSVVAKLHPSQRSFPSYVWVQNLHHGNGGLRYLSGGLLGAAYAPMRVGLDLDNPAADAFRFADFDPPPGISHGRLLDRGALLSSWEDPDPRPAPIARMRHHQERAFDLSQEDPRLRDRYGSGPLGQNLLLARRLIEAGVRLVSVNTWVGVAPGEKFLAAITWDMHGADNQGSIFGTTTFGLGFALPRVVQAVSALLEDLEVRGLLESTLVVAVGGFGRQPIISHPPFPGRDHWPACYSAVVAGAGVRGGLVYGASDKTGASVKDRPVSPEDFGATLFYALGIAPATRLAPDGFTRPASLGEPILDLFG
jgi:hypothetical protein